MILDLTLYLVAFFAFWQVAYCLFFYQRLLFFKLKNFIDFDFNKPVSVIVAAHNEIENLKILVPLLLKQNYPEFEVIIVDDRSEDDTYLYLLSEQRKDVRLKIVRIDYTPEHISHKKYALTLGIKAACYEHLLFIDADCLPVSEKWIALMLNEWQNGKEIVLGFSPYIKQKGFLNWIIRYETTFTAIQYFSYALAGLPYMGVGRNLGYTKGLFLRSKGFNKHLKIVGGDDDLFVNANATAQNTAICIHPEAHVLSYPKTTWHSWKTQKNRHLSVGKFYKKKHILLLGWQNAMHALFWFGLPWAVFATLWNYSKIEPIHWVWIGFLAFRLFFWATTQYFNAKKLKSETSYVSWLLFDCVYAFFIVFLGTKAFFRKPEQWS
jgi:glycosyltransferase involved in cell wall biosynthesis